MRPVDTQVPCLPSAADVLIPISPAVYTDTIVCCHGRALLTLSIARPPYGCSRAAFTPGPPCALPSPILQRLSSPSQRHATPCSAWLRGALARQSRRSRWHGRAVRTVGWPVGEAGAGALNFLSARHG